MTSKYHALSVGWCVAIAAACGAPHVDAEPQLSCSGALIQGGLAVCQTAPNADILFSDQRLKADENDVLVAGLRRNAPNTLIVKQTDGGDLSLALDIAERQDEQTIVRGASCDKIDARTAEQKAKAAKSWQLKQAGWARFHAGLGPLEGFQTPAEGRISSPFGFSRRYVTEGCPEKTRPHLGYDIAAPTGTQVVAPASGTIVLAETDLYYEGGTIFLDHGFGLVSIFLHLSAVDVELGEEVAAGQAIGAIGNTGRTTGPHLHWGVKWRNPDADDRGGDFYIDPAILLTAFPSAPAEKTRPEVDG